MTYAIQTSHSPDWEQGCGQGLRTGLRSCVTLNIPPLFHNTGYQSISLTKYHLNADLYNKYGPLQARGISLSLINE